VLVVDAALRVVGLRRTARLLRVPVLLDPAAVAVDDGPVFELGARERRRVRCVARVVRAVFGLDRGCLRFALATAVLLRAHAPGVRLGVRRGEAGGDTEVVAHAWVEIRGRTIRARNHVPLQAA
jgi:hypothetical protein